MARAFYPSVECGYINIGLAQENLGFNPTPLDECLKETLNFFEKIEKNQYVGEKIKVLEEMPTSLRKHIFAN